jgi:hypothetical protein
VTDGYVVDPAVLRSVAGALRDRADANGTAATYGLDAGVDAGRSTDEIASAVGWLTGELDKLFTSLDALAANLTGVADRYEADDEASAGGFGEARTPVGPMIPGVPQ